MKKGLVSFFGVLVIVSIGFSQTVMLTPYGISPRDAGADTEDIFDRAYNGLLNVGVETQMYLKGAVDGASLSGPAWTVVSSPSGSAADITTTIDMDTSSQVAVFTPDVVGTYVVEFADGGETAQVTINAGTYMGIEDGMCGMCHSEKASEWEKTGHFDLFEEGLNGVASSHYGAGCIGCHTTGYDANANNDGFDDRTQPVFDAEAGKLNAVPVTTAPVVDGEVDAVWAVAPALEVALGETRDVNDPSSIMDCAGCHAFNSEIKVTVKAVYTADSIYVQTQWPDPTASFTRGGSWSFANGAWEKPNAEQSEDRISFFWPMGDIAGNPYNTDGCMAKCHTYWPTDTDPHVSTHGIVDDAWLESGRADMWHSKAARGGAYLAASGSDLTVDPVTHQVTGGTFAMLGFADDKYVDAWAADDVNGEDGGRYGDGGSSAYSHNRIGDKSRPKFMETNPADYADAMVLTQDEIDAGECVGDGTTGVSDTDAAMYWPAYAELAAVVPERILRAPAGSRADLKFGAVWKDGMWTAEICRPLDTGTDDDIQFTDLDQEYPFGVAEFDNSRHGYQHRTSQMYDMKFLKAEDVVESPFVFPATLQEGTYAQMELLYPNSMKLARIQCESCHGPGSAHFGNTADSRIAVTLSSDNCAWCHDSGTHHVYPEQWDVSQHANPLYAGYAGGRANCAPCHSGAGFVAFVKGGKAPLSEAPPVTAITCATCHEPHDVTNPHQLRTLDVTLGNGQEVTDGGLGKLCMNCHKSRRNAVEYTGPDFSYSSHYGPHHGPQADMLIGTNVPTFGKTLPSSPHFSAVENACVGCHMAEGHVDAEGNVLLSGSHSFSMATPDGVDNVKACEECHGDIGESFAEKKYYFNGNADHDGDGMAEGVQEEIHGMLEELAMMLPPLDSNVVDIGGDYIYTETEAKAAYNYFFVEEDRSGGIHNPAFAVALLKVTKQALVNHALTGDIVEIADVPNDQGKMVRIIWNKMADDGVAVDPIAKYVVKRDDGDEVWTNVGEATADGSPRYALVVPTLFDSTEAGPALTSFKVVAVSRGGSAYESMPAEGYSVDNLVPAAPSGVLASLVGNQVQLAWDDPVDEDFNYFAVFRSTTAGFDPTGMEPIATLTGVEFTDPDVEFGSTYYYKLAAYDFSGNQSEFSEEVYVALTSVDSKQASGIPDNFVLMQNYPNPFNPSTSIEFGVPSAEHVSVKIYDVRGVYVRTLADGRFAAGYHTIHWDGRNDAGQTVSAGTFIYKLESQSTNITKKMIFLK